MGVSCLVKSRSVLAVQSRSNGVSVHIPATYSSHRICLITAANPSIAGNLSELLVSRSWEYSSTRSRHSAARWSVVALFIASVNPDLLDSAWFSSKSLSLNIGIRCLLHAQIPSLRHSQNISCGPKCTTRAESIRSWNTHARVKSGKSALASRLRALPPR